MKEKINKILFHPSVMITASIFAFFAPIFNYSMRTGNVYVDISTFNGFSLSLFLLMVLNTVLMFSLLISARRKPDKTQNKSYKLIYLISLLLTIIFSIVELVTFIVNLITGFENIQLAGWMLLDILPYAAVFAGTMFLAFIFPLLENPKEKKTVSIITCISLFLVFFVSVFPVKPYAFTSGPVVFDTGKDYSVVFSTNDIGTGYVKYEYDGKSMCIYDENNGRKLADSQIHTINVPYEHLNNNTYLVGSQRVIDELSYGGRNCKIIESDSVDFGGTFDSTIDVLTISDWHTNLNEAKQTISHIGDYQAVIMLGDSAPGIMFEGEVIRNIINFASDITNGTMPILFSRGNHETRGKLAPHLSRYLGMKSFYYTASIGDYEFIVLDSGEDKEDEHPEYGGMVYYNEHRIKMVDWLKTLDNENNKKTIALSHSDEICIEEDLANAAYTKLDQLNTTLLVSGHIHDSEWIEKEPFPVLLDGGTQRDNSKNYVATLMTLSENNIEIKACDTAGNNMLQKTINWR